MSSPARVDPREIDALELYDEHLGSTARWLLASCADGGGSRAHWSAPLGWSRASAESTGYVVPTLLALEARRPGLRAADAAARAGEWLLATQDADGSWSGGDRPTRGLGGGRVLGTARAIEGLVALARTHGESRWLDSAGRGARWLAESAGAAGSWPRDEPRSAQAPSGCAQVAWSMLETWSHTRDPLVRDAAVRMLRAIVACMRPNGAIEGLGLAPGAPASTHALALALRGLIECARILEDWETFGAPGVPALEALLKHSEYSGGVLAAAFDGEWRGVGDFTCLTGNAETAINLLLWERRARDPRVASAAAKLVEGVCATQSLGSPLRALRGGVAGSAPVWGGYMRFSYPNWAAKHHCDALMLVADRLEHDLVSSAGASGDSARLRLSTAHARGAAARAG